MNQFSPTELKDLRRFVIDDGADGLHRFSQSSELLVDNFLPRDFEVRVEMLSQHTSKKLTLQLRLEDFPDRRQDSDLDSSNSGLSHRIFEMTVALNEFGHKTDFDEFEDGVILRVLRYGDYLDVSGDSEG